MPKKTGPGKEILIAAVSGLIVALIITLVLYFRTNAHNPLPDPTAPPTATPVTSLPEKTPPPIEFLDLENESVFDHKEITLRGHTFPNLPVVIFVNNKNFLTQSDAQGIFFLDEITLESGSNHLQAIVTDLDNNSYSDQRLVVFTNKSLEEILVTDAEIANDQASNSATP